jgi:hypothetical protein
MNKSYSQSYIFEMFFLLKSNNLIISKNFVHQCSLISLIIYIYMLDKQLQITITKKSKRDGKNTIPPLARE